MTHQEAPGVAVPGEGPLHDPAAAVAGRPAELPAGRLAAPRPLGDAGLDPAPSEGLPKRFAVIAAVCRQPLGAAAGTPPRLGDSHRRQELGGEFQLVGLGRAQDAGDRKARFLDEDHPCGPRTFLGLADPEAPLFAGAKLPSR